VQNNRLWLSTSELRRYIGLLIKTGQISVIIGAQRETTSNALFQKCSSLNVWFARGTLLLVQIDSI